MEKPEQPERPVQRRWMSPDFLSELFSNPLDPGYADAAARRAKSGPPTGWRQTTRRTAAVLVAGLIGLLFAVAYRQTMADEPRRSQARADLVSQIKARQATTDSLRGQADRLRDEVARERDAALGANQAAKQRETEAATGLRRVTGDGLVVRLTDAADAAEDGGEHELGRIFDRDLQLVTNALWASGAEAIAVNDQRLTATSTIRKAGGAILVDFRPVTSPYEIRVIGPGDLEDRFEDSAAAALMRKVADVEHIGFDTHQEDDLNLPAATEPTLNYATLPAPPSATPTPVTSSSSPSGGG
ncbi:Uncharacterized conserved protein YlxW, UPF0749 family [Asanoa hainanensis]|uniref:Uncharacterized conserved protein YlxW, UPF0749 family n=2 Tax=Asanoa hainanensis TaxID=560556 RepID=A0A239FXS1_9ACTN|nr:Uncharacterized conserved protein YlxW, UPF0749 family [Asanoa hainanensis]